MSESNKKTALVVSAHSADFVWRVMLWGKNITNEYYWSNVVAGQDTIVRYAARPATYGVTVGFRY